MDGTLSEIRCIASTYAPKGWMLCNGQMLPISSNQALFSLLGTTYGGNGQTTFGLPNLNGRTAICAGAGPGLTLRNPGDAGGAQAVQLTQQQIPEHTHQATGMMAPGCSTGAGESTSPESAVPATFASSNLYSTIGDATMQQQPVTVQVQPAGGGGAHDNMPPFLGLNYMICTQGLYPPRP
jgi:microcystin-dependent protein